MDPGPVHPPVDAVPSLANHGVWVYSTLRVSRTPYLCMRALDGFPVLSVTGSVA